MASRVGAADCCDGAPGVAPPAAAKRDQFKVVILGDSGVGKTNLVKRFTTNSFTHESETTIGAAFQVHRDAATDTTLQIWDTAGQERYAQLVPLYYRGAQGAILVYDITDRHSLERAKRWKDELAKYGETSVVIALVGNKCDLAKDRTVSVAEAQMYASDENILFFETSALSNNPPVAAIFNKLTASMRQVKKYLPPAPTLPPLIPPGGRTEVDDQKCCVIS